jgi:hypothetical protein
VEEPISVKSSTEKLLENRVNILNEHVDPQFTVSKTDRLSPKLDEPKADH